MDVFERFSSKFGQWYEGLFGAGTGELRPRDVLRKITTSMEDNRKEGLDGKIYVPNHYMVELAVDNPDERDYLLSFLDEEELVTVLERFMEQNQYNVRGPLDFTIQDMPEADRLTVREKLRVKARFEKGAIGEKSSAAQGDPGLDGDAMPIQGSGHGTLTPIRKTTAAPPAFSGRPDPESGDRLPDDEDELVTVAAVAHGALAVTGVDGRKSHHSLTRPVVTIGRSRNSGNDVVLSGDGMVSKQHARLERERDGRFRLHDLGSTNGVSVNGTRVDGNVTLGNGDEIVIGATKLVFQQGTTFPVRGVAQPAGVPVPANTNAALAGQQDRAADNRPARLIATGGAEHLLGADTLIGRAITADIVLDDPSVATRHARIVSVDPSTYYIEDLGSPSGTSINGRPVPPHQRALLADGDVVMFGTRVLQFVGGRKAQH